MPKIINLSSIELSQEQLELLKRGIKFTPTPKNSNPNELKEDRARFCKRLRKQEYFLDKDYQDESLVVGKSEWTPYNGRDAHLDRFVDFITSYPIDNESKNKFNISLSQKRGLEALQNNPNITIKEADKGSAIVIMDSDYYENKMQEMLEDASTYEKLDQNIDRSIMNKVCTLVGKYQANLTKREISYLTKFDYKTSKFYGLPKIHKSKAIIDAINQQKTEYIKIPRPADLKFRPIVGGPASPTSTLSAIVDEALKPFLKHVKSYVRDDIDFLNHLPETISNEEIFVSFDIVSLYTNIDTTLGLEAIQFWLNAYPYEMDRLSREFILKSLELVLRNNTFEFSNNQYVQRSGTSMGTRLAPTFSTLVLAYLELKFYDKIEEKFGRTLRIKVEEQFKRYLDDCWIIWNKNDGNIEDIHEILNALSDKLKYTMEIGIPELPFLDVLVKRLGIRIITDIYHKPTDARQYLHYRSCHPRHIKNNVPYNLARRVCTIVSDPVLKSERLKELKYHLTRQAYPNAVIEYGIKKAMNIPIADLRRPTQKDKENLLPFVSKFSPNDGDFFRVIKQNIKYLNGSGRMKRVMSDAKLIKSTRQPPNLKQLLTRSSFKSKGPFKVSRCTDRRCMICQDNLVTGTEYQFPNSSTPFKFNCNMDCNTKNCIYVMTCLGCNSFYIGETDSFRPRVNNHRSMTNNNTGLFVNQHMHDCARNLPVKFSICPFYKVKSDSIQDRRAMEEHFIEKFSPDLNK